MYDFISQHSGLIQIGINTVTALVWVIYLQILVTGFRRQRRSNILIHRSAGHDDTARCVVSNMGAEPIHVTSIIADLEIEGETHSAVVTDRKELADNGEPNALDRTTQGPLESGASRDAGSFKELTVRALGYLGLDDRIDDVERITLTVAAATGHDTFLSAGQQSFRVEMDEGRHVFLPASTLTKQIRSRRDRRALRQRLDTVLKEEAEALRRRKDDGPKEDPQPVLHDTSRGAPDLAAVDGSDRDALDTRS